MTLYTSDDIERNYKARLTLTEAILHDKELFALHTKANRPALAKSALHRIVDAESDLYLLNKDYDEMLIAAVKRSQNSPKKTLIKKLLRK